MLLVLLFLCYAIIAWYHPRVALGLLFALLPSYLLRFNVGGIPMTVLEGFILVLAAAVLVWRRGGEMISPLPAGRGRSRGGGAVGTSNHWGGGSYNATPSHSPSMMEGEKRTAQRAPSPFADRMVVLAVVWVIAGTLAALGSDAGVKAWGLWKAYIVEPVLLYFVIRAIATGMSNDQAPMTKKISNLKFQISNSIPLPLTPPPHPSLLTPNPSSLNPLRHIILPLTIGAAGVAAVAVWQYFSGYGIPFPWQDIAMRRVTSVFGYPNAVGLYLAPIIPLALGLLVISRRATPPAASSPTRMQAGMPLTPPSALRRTPTLEEGEDRSTLHTVVALAFAAAVFLIAIVAVFFTRGAGAMVAVVAALASLPLLAAFTQWFSRHARGTAIAIITAWVAACLIITAVLPYQPERPRTGTQTLQKLTFQQWSGSVRLSQYREMWRLLRDHPIRGAGLSGYPLAIQQYKEKQNVETFQYPHNLLLAVWSEMGLLGLLIFLAITITFFARAFAQRRPATVIAAMLAVLTFGLVDIPIFKNDLATMWWTLLALGTVGFPHGTLAMYGQDHP